MARRSGHGGIYLLGTESLIDVFFATIFTHFYFRFDSNLSNFADVC